MFAAHWPQLSQRLVTLATLRRDEIFLTTPSSTRFLRFPQRNWPFPVSTRSKLSRLRCHGHSLLLSSYLNRIKRKENSFCSACGHPLQNLTHLFLDRVIFGSTSFIFDLWSKPWFVARLLGLRKVPPRFYPSDGVGEPLPPSYT